MESLQKKVRSINCETPLPLHLHSWGFVLFEYPFVHAAIKIQPSYPRIP